MTGNIISFPARPAPVGAEWSDLDSVQDILIEIIMVNRDPALVQLHAVEALELVEAMITKGGAA